MDIPICSTSDSCNGQQETHCSLINKRTVNETSTDKENEGAAFSDKNADFYEIIRGEANSILQDPSINANKSIPILKTFRHSSIDNLHQIFGYSKSVLKLASWMLLLQDKEITDGSMNDLYWECMHHRLDKHGGRIVAGLLTDIGKVEETMTTTLQEASKICLKCCICKEGPVAVLYLPCGHLILCSQCFNSDMKSCQACLSAIDEVHSIYM